MSYSERKDINDQARRIFISKCRKVSGRYRLKRKSASGKSCDPICTHCHDRDDIVRIANYKDSYGIVCLCAGHAHDNGTHSIFNACVACGLTGRWRDESGYYCATHARERGIYAPLVKRKCVNDEKDARVRDPASGDALCRACATHRGVKYNLCVMCPAETAVQGYWRHPITRKPSLRCSRQRNECLPTHLATNHKIFLKICSVDDFRR